MALFIEKPASHLHSAQSEQPSGIDLKSLTTEGLPDPAQNAAGGAGTPTV